jgi:hypothetical protein
MRCGGFEHQLPQVCIVEFPYSDVSVPCASAQRTQSACLDEASRLTLVAWWRTSEHDGIAVENEKTSLPCVAIRKRASLKRKAKNENLEKFKADSRFALNPDAPLTHCNSFTVIAASPLVGKPTTTAILKVSFGITNAGPSCVCHSFRFTLTQTSFVSLFTST